MLPGTPETIHDNSLGEDGGLPLGWTAHQMLQNLIWVSESFKGVLNYGHMSSIHNFSDIQDVTLKPFGLLLNHGLHVLYL